MGAHSKVFSIISAQLCGISTSSSRTSAAKGRFFGPRAAPSRAQAISECLGQTDLVRLECPGEVDPFQDPSKCQCLYMVHLKSNKILANMYGNMSVYAHIPISNYSLISLYLSIT